MKRGIDVSKWDNKPLKFPPHNWDFMYIKCGEGLYPDSMFPAHWAAGRGHILRGGYHYFRPSIDPKTSALKCAAIMKPDLGELPLALDLETTDGKPAATVLEGAKSWLSWYEDATGTRPIIYSGIPFLTQIGARGKAWLAAYDFWYAQYPYDNFGVAARTAIIKSILDGTQYIEFPRPDLFPPMKIVIWQWTSRATPEMIPGYACDKLAVDVNFARDEWLVKFTNDAPPAPEKRKIILPNGREYQEA